MKIEQQIAEMKEQTFGVEVEMNNITRPDAAKIVAGYFGTTAYDSEREYGYYSWSCKDRKNRVWKFEKDCSIEGDDAHKCEMVTPILTYEDMEDLQEIIRLLRRAKAKSDSSRMCGVHVHVGANGHTPETLRNLANIMASHETLLIQSLALNRERINRYCSPVDPRFIKMVNNVKPHSMSRLADVWYKSQGQECGRNMHYNSSRYHMLNLHATFTKGTVEFRLFQFYEPTGNRLNGLNAGQLKAYVQLCLALSEMAKVVKRATPKPQQNENPKYAMRTWLLRLGFVGDEFKTARKILTERLSGDTSFRDGVRPGKVIGD